MKLPAEWRELLSLIPGYDSEATADPTDYFDPEAASLAISFFPEVLQFIEGERAGEPFELESWQQAIVAALFGWKRADGTRRYRETLIYVPRKNGKSPFCAGLTLLVAFTDGEPGGQLYSAAADREQSALIYRHMAGMIEREPMMASRCRVYRSFKSVEFPDNTIYKALSSDANTKHGLGASFVVVDELHAHKDDELVQVLLTSTAARRQPLIIYITTADYDRPSICNSKHAYASKVRDGEIQDRAFLPVIYEAGPDDDWTDPAVWAKANPNLGISVSLEYLERECERAKNEPSYTNTFRRLHLNQKTSTASLWIPLEAWDACKRALPDLTGRECYAGLDLSTTTDISAFVLAFPPLSSEEPTWLLPFFWIPEAKLQDRRDRVPYPLWARQGLVTVTPGNVVDYDRIRADINALAGQFAIREVRYDSWNATQLATQLDGDGFTLTQVRQGFPSLNEPSKELERRVMGGTLGHDGNPVLRWMIGHTAIESDAAGNIKPSKKKSTQRIDGTVATVMAVSGAMTADMEPSLGVIFL